MKRLAGYDIDPLRIDIMTTIEHSKLVHNANILRFAMKGL